MSGRERDSESVRERDSVCWEREIVCVRERERYLSCDLYLWNSTTYPQNAYTRERDIVCLRGRKR